LDEKRRSRQSAPSRSCGVPFTRSAATGCRILTGVSAPLIEFPADDPERARRFWRGVLGAVLAPRPSEAGAGWEASGADIRLGLHQRGSGPGDNASLPYFTVPDLPAALQRVHDLGGSVIHPGERWAVCRDSEGSPFALAADL
jgi:predicted enzyme related to lactoylglutathione lyase